MTSSATTWCKLNCNTGNLDTLNFELTSAQQEIVRQIRSLCTNFPDEYWREQDARAEFPQDFFEAIAKAGYLGVAIPEKYGGSGLGITEAALILLEVAASGAAMAGASSIHLSIFGVSPLVFHGTDEQKSRYLPKVISGETQVAFSITEPDAGNDITQIKTAARREGDHYIINGRKVFTTKAREAQKMLLLTRTTPFDKVEKKTDGMSLFFADLDPSSVEIRELHKLGRAAVDTNMLFIDNLRVPATDLGGQRRARIPLFARRTQPGTDFSCGRSDRYGTRRALKSRSIRQGTDCF